MPLPHVPRFTLRLEGSGTIADMHSFMTCLYQYWYHKGYWGVVTSSIVDFLNVFALFIVAFIFTMRFDWVVALRCDEAECATSTLIHGVSRPYVFRRTFGGYLFGFVFLASTLAACVYEGVMLAETLYVHLEVEQIVRDAGVDTGFLTPLHRWWHEWQRSRLLSEDGPHEAVSLRGGGGCVLATSTWGDLLQCVCDAFRRSPHLKGASTGVEMDVLLAVQTLMQQDNYLIALCEGDLLNQGALLYMDADTLQFLVSLLFDAFHTVDSRLDVLAWRVKEAVVRYVVMYVVFYPFFATYSVVKVLVKNAAQFKSNYREFSRREWTERARWTFRLYNEVDHLQACRLANGREIAGRMVEHLTVSNSLSRLVRRTSSTCVLVTIIVSFLNPSLLIVGRVGGLTFVWWLTLALLLYAMFSDEDPREREYVYTADLELLVQSIHHTEDEWYTSGDAFLHRLTQSFFRSRVYLICSDLLRTLLKPLVLVWAVRDGSFDGLISYVQRVSVTLDGVGSVAAGCVFEDERRTDDGRSGDSGAEEGEEEQPLGTSGERARLHSTHRVASTTAANRSSVVLGSRAAHAEKVKRSIASFAGVYSQWMLQHLDNATTGSNDGASLDASEGGRPSLRVFLRGLNERVCQRVDSLSRLPLDASALGPMTAEGQLLLSSQGSWAPGFSARNVPNPPREGGERDGAIGQSSALPFVMGTTAHERERLFVSQVMDTPHVPATRHSDAYTAVGREGGRYGGVS